jgi:RNA polymerase sigma-70 factor (ECF subfamily)
MTDMLAGVNESPPPDARSAGVAARVLEGSLRAAYRGWVNDAARPLEAADLAALVLRVARDSDRAAFAALFGHFAPRVKAYLLRLGADAASAEDVMQEVMVAVWRRAATYDPTQAGVGTWVFTIARNKRIDALRRDRRSALDADDPMLAPAAPPEPERVAARGEWERRLGVALLALPREQSEMLRLAFFEDLSHGEIARRLQLPLGTVKSRVRLAIMRLRQRFPDEDSPA